MERGDSRGHGLLELTPKVLETGWVPNSLWWDTDKGEFPVLALKPAVRVLTAAPPPQGQLGRPGAVPGTGPPGAVGAAPLPR